MEICPLKIYLGYFSFQNFVLEIYTSKIYEIYPFKNC